MSKSQHKEINIMSNSKPKADRDIDLSEYTPDDRGIPTAKWDKLGFTEAADPAEVEKCFPGHTGKVAIGLLRGWLHANDSQLFSAEYQETFDSVNADVFGVDTPKVFPREDYPAR